MQRWLIVLALLCLVPGFAWAAPEVCTHPATTHNWTAICTISPGSLTGCTCDDTDTHVIPASAVVTITTGSSIDFSNVVASTIAGVTVNSDGSLVLEAGAALALGYLGMTVESGGTFAANGKVRDPPNAAAASLDFDNDAPDTTDYATVGDVVHCPGDAGGIAIEDCEADGTGNEATNAGVSEEIALCWPDARYKDVAGDAIPGRRFFDDWVGEMQATSGFIAGDVITFWDPEPARLGRKARDVNASYEIVDDSQIATASNCIYLNVHQDGQNSEDQGYGLAERSVGYAVINTAATTGVRTILSDDADANYDAAAADNQRKARYLTCPDADAPSGAYVQPGWSAGIIDTDDDTSAGATDTLTLDTHGIRADVTAGDECFIDYGWARGDPIFAWRPATITSATDVANNGGGDEQASREDSNIDFQAGSIVTMNYVVLDTVGHVNFNGVTTLDANNLWFRDVCNTNDRNANVNQDDITLNRWQLTGANGTDDSCHGVRFTSVSDVTLNDWNTRHLSDDSLYSLTSLSNLNVNRLRVSFSGGDGTNTQQVFNGANSGDTAYFNDLLCEDCSEDADGATDSVFQMADDLDDGTVILEVNNMVAIGLETGISTEQNATGTDTGQAFRNFYILGLEAAFLRIGDINYLNRFTFRDVTVTDATNGHMLSGANIIEMTDGLFIDNTIAAPNALFWPVSLNLVRNVGFLNPATSSVGTADRLISFTGEETVANGGFLGDRITIVTNAGDAAAGNSWERIVHADGATAQGRVMTGLLIHGFHDDAGAATGWFDAGTHSFDEVNSKNWCFSDNDTDIHTASDEDAPTSTLRDEDPGFYDKSSGDFRLDSNSRFAKQGCGAQGAGAADMWALRVRNINPLESGDSWFVPVLHTDGGGAY